MSRSPVLSNLLREERGSTGMVFALSMVPVIMLIGGAVDIGTMIAKKQRLQGAADAAVLAAASMSYETTNAQRESKARAIFAANATGLNASTPSVTVNNSTVSLTTSSNVATTFLRLANINSMNLQSQSTAKSTYPTSSGGGKACLLALDPSSTDGIHIQGDNHIAYPTCWAHTNSTQSTAINANGSQATAVGAGHCASGGYSAQHANFSPTPLTGCVTVDDPYATVGAYGGGTYTPTFTPPTIPSTCKASGLSLKKGVYTLDPGRYCGGIDIQAQATVTFNPGVYIIDNGLFKVQSGSSVSGSNVLFYFSGADARMTVIGGGVVSLVGRSSGSSYEGFLFIAHPDAWRGNESNIQGGGVMNLEGMLYMPTQRILVSGNGDVNGLSKYFGMVAKDFYFAGNGTFNLRTKNTLSNLADIMPTMPADVKPTKVNLTQ